MAWYQFLPMIVFLGCMLFLLGLIHTALLNIWSTLRAINGKLTKWEYNGPKDS